MKNASNTTVRTLFTNQPLNGGTCFSGPNNTVTWNGRNGAGVVVADGNYTINLHAVATNNTTADLGIPTIVDTRTPATLVEPTNNQTLAGLVRMTYAPTSGFTGITEFDGCFSNSQGPGQCPLSVFNASPDGKWRTTVPASTLNAGPADFNWAIQYQDAFGSSHNWTAPTAPHVAIDTVHVALAFSATPTSGAAPLSTTLKVDASDPQNRPLSYTVDYGDGSATVSGTITPPYATVSLPHTYTNPGSFQPTCLGVRTAPAVRRRRT